MNYAAAGSIDKVQEDLDDLCEPGVYAHHDSDPTALPSHRTRSSNDSPASAIACTACASWSGRGRVVHAKADARFPSGWCKDARAWLVREEVAAVLVGARGKLIGGRFASIRGVARGAQRAGEVLAQADLGSSTWWCNNPCAGPVRQAVTTVLVGSGCKTVRRGRSFLLWLLHAEANAGLATRRRMKACA